MRPILSALTFLLKVAVMVGLVAGLLAASLWILSQANVITFRSPPSHVRSPSGRPADAPGGAGDADIESQETDDEAHSQDASPVPDPLLEKAEAAKSKADREYRELRAKVSGIMSARSPADPQSSPEVLDGDGGALKAEGDATPETRTPAALPDAPGYRDLRRRLARIPAAQPRSGSQTAAEPVPAVEPVDDAPEYGDLKQRLASALGRE